MKKLTPDPPVTSPDAVERTSQLLDRAAADRALDYYLHSHKPPRHMDQAMYAIPGSVN